MTDVRLHIHALDVVIIAAYFVTVIGIGIAGRRAVSTSMDFLLAGRSMPAWITGLAFISANLGAIEVLGMTANGAAYGFAPMHYYWVGAIPAMVALGLIMMPFYYGSKVRSVPEYLRLRFNAPTHLVQSVLFAIASILIAGINLYAFGLILDALLGWPLWICVIAAAAVVLAYTLLGGLSAAIYNEVLQFFVIVAALLPLTIVGLHRVGGWNGLKEQVAASRLGEYALQPWHGTGLENTTNPYGNWIGIAFGLGFVLSFGYWTTNFAEVQRALSAKDMSAARRTPLIAAFPKMVLPAIVILPGVLATVLVPGIGDGTLAPNDALPALIQTLLPSGLIGLAIAGLLASFMAGMAANLSAFNTVLTYDIWQPYVQRGRSDAHYLRIGKRATVVGVIVAVASAGLAAGYDNIGSYIQSLNSFFNAPLFATFIVGMFWKRSSAWSGFFGLVSGMATAIVVFVAHNTGIYEFSSDQNAAFWGAGLAFLVDVLVMVVVSLVTKPVPAARLTGLVWTRGALRAFNTAARLESVTTPISVRPAGNQTSEVPTMEGSKAATASADTLVGASQPPAATATEVPPVGARRRTPWWESVPLLSGLALAGCILLNVLFQVL